MIRKFRENREGRKAKKENDGRNLGREARTKGTEKEIQRKSKRPHSLLH